MGRVDDAADAADDAVLARERGEGGERGRERGQWGGVRVSRVIRD